MKKLQNKRRAAGLLAAFLLMLCSAVFAYDSIVFHRLPVGYRQAVNRLMQPNDSDAPDVVNEISQVFPYLPESTRDNVSLFLNSGDGEFAYQLARMSVLVDYRRHFIGFPEWLEEYTGLYGYKSSPLRYFIPVFMVALGMLALLLRKPFAFFRELRGTQARSGASGSSG